MKRHRIILAIVLCLCVAVNLMAVSAFAADSDIDGNVSVVIQYSPVLTGSGTKEDPYYGELNYRASRIETTTIETENPLASINGGGNSLTVTLNYGWNDIEFTVTSADGENTAYYHIRWSRTKLQREEDLKSSDVITIPANGDAADGKITGLDAEDTYEYRRKGSTDWTTVSGTSEITGLAAGTYEIKYGESATHQAQGGSAASVIIGNSQETMNISNETSYEIEVKTSASEGERVDFKIKLDKMQPVSDVEIRWYYSPPSGFGSNSKISQWAITGYESDEENYYAVGYFIMPSYQNYKVIKVESVTLVEGTYYSIAKANPEVANTIITPENSDDVMLLNGEKIYKEGSTVTIELSPNTSFGVDAITGFDVCFEDGTAAVTSADGKSVSVEVTGNLKIANVQASYTPADFTAMEEQLARLDGVDLTLYTDSTRVDVEERVALSKQMYKCLAKDQYLVDEFVPTLKEAIDNLTPKAGDFSKIQELKKAIPKDLSVYENETVKDLNTALEKAQKAVDEGWNRLRQTEIDKLADALEDAIAALEYRPADYTKVDAAVKKAEALNKEDYKDFSKVEAALKAVDRDKNITQQSEVDAMAKAIEDAIAGLVKKTDTKPENPNTPVTGDETLVPVFIGFAVLAVTGLVAIRAYTKKSEEK